MTRLFFTLVFRVWTRTWSFPRGENDTGKQGAKYRKANMQSGPWSASSIWVTGLAKLVVLFTEISFSSWEFPSSELRALPSYISALDISLAADSRQDEWKALIGQLLIRIEVSDPTTKEYSSMIHSISYRNLLHAILQVWVWDPASIIRK